MASEMVGDAWRACMNYVMGNTPSGIFGSGAHEAAWRTFGQNYLTDNDYIVPPLLYKQATPQNYLYPINDASTRSYSQQITR